METFLCDKCNKLFYNADPCRCPHCNSVYVIWITYEGRSKKEVKALLKKAAESL